MQAKMSDIEEDNQQMRSALCGIANEVQLFHSKTPLDETFLNGDVLGVLIKYKNAMKLKKNQIKFLKQNLKLACAVAKTLSAAKVNETTLLNNQLRYARNQYWELEKQQKQKTDMISTLQAENQTLSDSLQNFNNFIELGFKELQKIQQNEPLEDVPILKQLQMIIYYCGQYYAEHHNQLEKCNQLEQKNRFLNSKLRILENQLDVTLAKKGSEPKYTDIGIICSEYQIMNANNPTNLKMTKIELNRHSRHANNRHLDLSGHISAVSKLLRDQDTLLKDLNWLSKELNVQSFIE